MPIHKLMDGDLQVFKRTGRRHWQCAASIGSLPEQVFELGEDLLR